MLREVASLTCVHYCIKVVHRSVFEHRIDFNQKAHKIAEWLGGASGWMGGFLSDGCESFGEEQFVMVEEFLCTS